MLLGTFVRVGRGAYFSYAGLEFFLLLWKNHGMFTSYINAKNFLFMACLYAMTSLSSLGATDPFAPTLASVHSIWELGFNVVKRDAVGIEQQPKSAILAIDEKFKGLFVRGKSHDEDGMVYLQRCYVDAKSEICTTIKLLAAQNPFLLWCDLSTQYRGKAAGHGDRQGKTIFYQALEDEDIELIQTIMGIDFEFFGFQIPKFYFLLHGGELPDTPQELLARIPDEKFSAYAKKKGTTVKKVRKYHLKRFKQDERVYKRMKRTLQTLVGGVMVLVVVAIFS